MVYWNINQYYKLKFYRVRHYYFSILIKNISKSRRLLMNRRELIKNGLLLGSAATLPIKMFDNKLKEDAISDNQFKHSVSRWCFADIELEELCKFASKIGMHSIELTGPEEWAVMSKYNLTCAMGWDTYPTGVGLDNYYTNPDNHQLLYNYYKSLIPKAKEAGVNNLICLSGQRQGRSSHENLLNCKKGIDMVMPIFEDADITLSMEYLNSKVDHPDHQFDNMGWGITLCEMVDSPNFKILYDIYHAQIMEGDVVSTINKYHSYISHYHTAGVPGRHIIDNTQELNYKFIMQEIKKTGYTGFIGQEFIPNGNSIEDKLKSLKTAVEICNV